MCEVVGLTPGPTALWVRALMWRGNVLGEQRRKMPQSSGLDG